MSDYEPLWLPKKEETQTEPPKTDEPTMRHRSRFSRFRNTWLGMWIVDPLEWVFNTCTFGVYTVITGKEPLDKHGNYRNTNGYYGSNHKGSPW
jgi:hypothetical protein